MKRSVSILLVFLMVFFISPISLRYNTFNAINNDENLLTIFHTNDMHGNVAGIQKKGKLTNIGLDYVKNMKDTTKNSLLLDAGDAIQGNSLANYSQGRAIIDLMNATGYDASTLGNHCLDFGKKAFEDNALIAKFPLLCANLKYIKNDRIDKNDPLDYVDNGDDFLTRLYRENGKSNLNGRHMIVEKEINGEKYKIGIFGITTSDTTQKMNPKNVDDMQTVDATKIAISESKYLRNTQKVDLVVALTHLGMNEGGKDQSYKIAQEAIKAGVPIDIIVDGHSHSAANMYVDGNGIKTTKLNKDATNEQSIQIGSGTVIQQTFKELSYVGQIKVNFANKKISYKLLTPLEVQNNYKPDESVTNLYKSIYDGQSEIRDEQIAISDKSLYSYAHNGIDNEKIGERIVRFSECTLGNLVTDAFRWNAKKQIPEEYSNLPIIGLQNSAAIRSRIEAGPVTRGQIDQVCIFGGNLTGKKVSPKVLYSILENSVSKIPMNPATLDTGISCDDGRFLQVSGIRFEYDPNNKVGSRVKAVYLLDDNGEYSKTPLDKNDTNNNMIIVINDFEATGQDDYTMISELEEVYSGNSDREALADYLKNIKDEKTNIFSVPLDQNRITLVNNGGFKGTFDSIVTVVDNSTDEIVKNTKVLISIDNNKPEEFTTNSDGQVVIKGLTVSGHNIGIDFDNMHTDGYVDGRTGNADLVLYNDSNGIEYDMKNVALRLFESSKAINQNSADDNSPSKAGSIFDDNYVLVISGIVILISAAAVMFIIIKRKKHTV